MREIVISKNEAGQRLNKLVMKYLNKAPSSFVYRMIRKKNIKLNNGKAVGNEIVYVGDVIQLYLLHLVYLQVLVVSCFFLFLIHK